MDVEKIRTVVPIQEIKDDLMVRKAKDLVVAAAVATEGKEASEEQE